MEEAAPGPIGRRKNSCFVIAKKELGVRMEK
jgi:hypothetical protein